MLAEYGQLLCVVLKCINNSLVHYTINLSIGNLSVSTVWSLVILGLTLDINIKWCDYKKYKEKGNIYKRIIATGRMEYV